MELWQRAKWQRKPPSLVPAGHAGPHWCYQLPTYCSFQRLLNTYRLLYLLLLFLLLSIYTQIHGYTKYISTIQLAPLHFLLFLCILHYLDREKANSLHLLLTQINTFLRSATFLLISTFWYSMRCSLKTSNYASLLFCFFFKFFLPNDLVHNCFQLC